MELVNFHLSSLTHFYLKNYNPYDPIEKSITLPYCKIGENAEVMGFLQEKTIEDY
jgi:hypothetical protein